MSDVTPLPSSPTPSMPPWVPRLIATVIAFVTGAWVLIQIAGSLRGLLINILLAFVLSLAMEPAVHWLAKRGWRRGPATGLVFGGVAVVGMAVVLLILPALVSQLAALVSAIPGWLTELAVTLEDQFDLTIDLDTLENAFGVAGGDLASFAADLGTQAIGVGAAVLGFIFDALTVALFTFYLVADGPRMRRVMLTPLPAHRQEFVLEVWEVAIDKTGGYVSSRVLLAGASAVVTWLALTLLGVPFALALAVFVGIVSQFIPAVGTYIAAIVPVLVAFTVGVTTAVGVLIVLIAYQQVENYLIAPRVTARTMALHPAIAFGATIAGAGILGVIGALIALPIAATIQSVASTLVRRNELVGSWLFDEPATAA